MKQVSVYDAIGMVLCHDLTRIVPGESKGVAFKRGHVVCEEDIPQLLKIGKEHLFVWDLNEGFVHEDDAAFRIAKATIGEGISFKEPHEGKIELVADYDGLLKINTKTLYEINSIPDIMLSTIHTNQRVSAGQKVGGTRIIPLVIEDKVLMHVEDICKPSFPMIEIKKFKPNLRVGIVTTGSEVFHGRIQDAFGPVLKRKVANYGGTVVDQLFAPDDVDLILEAVNSLLAKGVDIITLTGGMSVDPDDLTPTSIKRTGAEVVTYGVPVLPGAMFMLAYLGDVVLMGLPGCVMFHSTTIFDIVFPLIHAGERPTKADLMKYAHGGFCQSCEVCHYPVCGFGKQG